MAEFSTAFAHGRCGAVHIALSNINFAQRNRMTYLVFCTFDLKNASSQDYQNAYADLEKIGLRKVQKSDNAGDVVIPTTSVMGEFNGNSAKAVRDDVRTLVKSAFSARRFKSEIFVVVGGDWAWGAGTT